MNTKEYANKLVRINGLPVARRIAGRCVEASHPDVWASLPKGKVFTNDNSGRDGGTLTKRQAEKTYAFWLEVKGHLKNEQ